MMKAMILPALLALALPLGPQAAPAALTTETHTAPQISKVRQCSQRAGPYVTQSTAWRRWRQARAEGYAVSRGVVPCGGGTYCFWVFYPC